MTAAPQEQGEGVLALLLTGPSLLEPVQIPPPTPLDGEVLVDVDVVGICGSEVHDSKVMEYRRPPIVMGHEIVGRLADGSRVAVDPLIACGTCTPCQSGRSNVCTSRAVLGIHRTGGFTSAIAVPRAQLTLIPSTLSDLQGVMAEPLANGLHAWTLSGASAASRIGIIGAGAIGLSVALVALANGVTELDVVEPVASRREAAAAIGATTRNRLGSGYDAIFDCAGSSTTHKESLTALANGGTAIWLGLMDRDANFDSTNLVREEKSVRGSYGYTHDEFERAVTLAVMVPISWIEEHRLVEGPVVFDSLWRGELTKPKIVLRPDRPKGV